MDGDRSEIPPTEREFTVHSPGSREADTVGRIREERNVNHMGFLHPDDFATALLDV